MRKANKPKKRNEKKESVNLRIHPKVAKATFIGIFVLLFFAISLSDNFSFTSFTTYSIVDAPNPGINIVIFFVVMILAFFLMYEKKN
ncbi:hypothetical protein HYX16_03810 [Candidatus Woesearchaeota archaeon]|nr:hypothetical protein [Candidatus Woesearchaeota archaeon]